MPTPQKFSHLDEHGAATMVGIGHKAVVFRRATASGQLLCAPATIRLLQEQALPKGDVLGVARIAGIQAVKRTADLIPLCHPLPLHRIEIDFRVRTNAIEITCTVEAEAKTGVEMEALTGVSVAALTLYDMCKAVDKKMSISEIHVIEKIKKSRNEVRGVSKVAVDLRATVGDTRARRSRATPRAEAAFRNSPQEFKK
jgi:cyclic pyranopterin phosphate synthase